MRKNCESLRRSPALRDAVFQITLLLMATLSATRAAPPERNHEITPEDYFTLAGVNGCAVSPDAQFVAYTEMRWEPPEEKRNTDIWVVDRKSKSPLRLTFDSTSDSSPSWSPDGRFIYFTNARKQAGQEKPPFDGKKQVWRVSPRGGDPFSVTRVHGGIGFYELSADGSTLYYTSSEEHVEEEWSELRKQYKKLKYGHGLKNVGKVWSLDLNTWRTEKLVDESRVIGGMSASRDGRRIAMLTTPDEELIFHEGWSRVDVYDSNKREAYPVTPDGWRKDHPSPFGWIDNIAWADDGNALAFSVSFDGYPTRIYVVEWSGETHSLRELDRPEGVTVVGGTLKWRRGTRDLCFLGDQRARVRVYTIENVQHGRAGKAQTLTEGDVVVGAFDFSSSGKQLAVVMSSPEHMEDVFAVSRSDEYERLTRVNPQVDTWKLPQLSVVQWTGANGDQVEGILELPPDYRPGKPLPMIVEIHGGPTAATHFSLRYWIYGRTLLPAKGFALLSPNYRGSTGYGDKFMIELIGRENDIEVEDILKGVDAMIERGIADSNKLGVMGWSNGGYLTNCLITATDRFKAASSGAGVLDMVIQWGIEDTPGHVINYMQSLPWEDEQAYRAGSPIFALDKVKTPTVIHVGENDERVPAAHAKTLYRALRHYLHVPTELIIYPGEGHGLTTYEHRKAKLEWDLAWFNRYLLQTQPPPEPEPVTN